MQLLLPGLVVLQPCHRNAGRHPAKQHGYQSGTLIPGPGHAPVEASEANAMVSHERSANHQSRESSFTNGDVAFACAINPRGTTDGPVRNDTWQLVSLVRGAIRSEDTDNHCRARFHDQR
jgi:hypothetical protein